MSITSVTSNAPGPKVNGVPILPVGILILGGYLTWFGVHYWRSDVKWPSDPVKAVLTGKPLPDPANTSDATLGKNIGNLLTGPGGGGGGRISAESNPTGSVIADAALKYVGAGYVFGGNASRVGDWDCSSFVSYVLGHDLGLPLPGGKWGNAGFPPNAHGPVASAYKLYGASISAAQCAAGDIVAWNTHVGIAISNTEIVSARSPSEGTGKSTISGTSQSINETPTYRRITVTPNPVVSV